MLAGVTNTLLSAETRARDPEAVANVRNCLTRADCLALVTAIRSISLGREDLTPILPSIAETAAAIMPDATSAVVKNGGHLTPFESPAETATLLRRLWRE